jgi:hypothetical protein
MSLLKFQRFTFPVCSLQLRITFSIAFVLGSVTLSVAGTFRRCARPQRETPGRTALNPVLPDARK